MITVEKDLYVLETEQTGYAFMVEPGGLCRHLYYGPRLPRTEDYRTAAPRRLCPVGNGAVDQQGVCREDLLQEAGTVGWGDPGEPLVKAVTRQGCRALDFRFAHYQREESHAPEGLPRSRGGETLKVVLRHESGLYLELYYTVFESCDAIVRRSRLVNDTGGMVEVQRLLSMQLDLPARDYTLTTFRGAWAREMERLDQPLRGKLVWESTLGTSSNRCNPFAMVSVRGAGETHGQVWACNLLYSGNHYGCAGENPYGGVRVVQGMGELSWRLEPGQALDAPEAVLAYSSAGFRGVSRCMHRFIKEHILPPAWQGRSRPVVVNSWEALYFKLNRRRLLELARQARDIGAEVLVVDDGWFTGRKDDTCALGDWQEDARKLPGGFDALAEDLEKLGLGLGIWVEPEMVSEKSGLFRSHPDWILGHRQQAMGRQQYVLDLGRREVCDYIYDSVAALLKSGHVQYVKWDMNRIITDSWSGALPPERQGEALHRYMLGLYSILERLAEEFPQVLFESCASGGNRADLGMLCYMPQLWASDNTDAACRSRIQDGYSYGYPQSVLGCHVSAVPNHQTLRFTPLHSRFYLACFGLLGYELDLTALTAEEKKALAEQVAFYKKHRELLQWGDFYRIPCRKEEVCWMVARPDGSEAMGVHFTGPSRPNQGMEPLPAVGLHPEKVYRLTALPTPVALEDFGTLVNMRAPVKLRSGTPAYALARRVMKLREEPLDLTASGALFLEHGFYPAQIFDGTGYTDGMGLQKDWDSRLYHWQEQPD